LGWTRGTLGDGRGVYRVWLGGLKARDHWEDLGVVWSITLKWTLGRWVSVGLTGFKWLTVGSSGGLL
jgi:hypothetical protein